MTKSKINLSKRKMTVADLSWGVHPRLSGMQAEIKLRNGFKVDVVYLAHQQQDHPGFECKHYHSNPKVHKYMTIHEGLPKPVKGLSIEEVDAYIQDIQALPRPLVWDTELISSH